MLVSAAVCPHPLLLVPELAVSDRPEIERLRRACLSAIGAVRATSPELLVVVGAGESTRQHPVDDVADFRPFGVETSVRLPGASGPPDGSLPMSLSVGAWLLQAGGWPSPVSAMSVGRGITPERCREVGAEVAELADRVALLVMADGSVRRTDDAPRPFDPRAAGFDASVATALRDGDPDALSAIDGELGGELGADGVEAWRVLAGAAEEATMDAELLYDDAPFGVGYVVAVWERHG